MKAVDRMFNLCSLIRRKRICHYYSGGRPLVLTFGILALIATVIFLYMARSSISLFSPCSESKHAWEQEVIFLNQNNQSQFMKSGAYKKLKSSPTRKHIAVFPVETKEVIKKGDGGPSLQMELARWSIAQTSHDLWFFLRHQMKLLQGIRNMSSQDTFKEHQKIVKYTLDNVAEYHSAINDQLKILADSDGWNSWRKREAQELHNTVQKRLYALQNPQNCSAAPVLLCNLDNPYGFASGLHDVLWCFVKAYHLQERMVLITPSWHYAPDGWETLFRPLTDTCGNERNLTPASFGPGINNGKARALLEYLPSDLGPRIHRIHGNPIAWWYGQFIKFLLRPNNQLEASLQGMKQKINFNSTIVGVHVRRTDKIGSEAQFYKLEEYMEYAEDYFAGKEMIQGHPIQRRVYLATDDPKVITECRNRYPEYDCIHDSLGAAMAFDSRTRYSNASLFGLLADLYMLANTDFLVCTFSSGICRLAYELMHGLRFDDCSDRFVSLDVQYHYAAADPPPRVAVYSHKAKSAKETNFKQGEVFQSHDWHDLVYEARHVKGNSGFSYFAKPSGKGVFIPTYKTKEIFRFIGTRSFADYDSSFNGT